MEKKLVSVIMSTYKEDQYHLIKAIESIVNQTYSNLEIIIILDNPESIYIEKIIEQYVQKDKRIIFIKNRYNLGLTNSLNKALDMATGEYIARMDADDISHLKRLEKQVEFMSKNQVDLLGTDIKWISEQGDTIYDKMGVPTGIKNLKKLLMTSNCVAHPTWLVKREVYKSLNGYRDIPMNEDYDFLLRAVRNNYKIDNLPEVLLSYRMTSGSISRSNGLKQFLISRYLQCNIKNIDEINKNDILRSIESKLSLGKERRFAQSNHKMNQALIKIYKKEYTSAIFNLGLAFLNSKDFGSKMLRLIWCKIS